MNAPFFSIIIPAYNCESFISYTLESILNQNFKDYEIIIVNDGSIDNTLNICRNYENKNKNITCINKENEGVSIARNKALEIAKGNYILFIDADDIIYPGSLLHINNILQNKNIDFLKFEYNIIDTKGKLLFPNYNRVFRKKFIDKDYAPIFFMDYIMKDEYFMCMHVFKRKIIEDNKLSFLAHCTINEDTLFITQYLAHTSLCYYTDKIIYGYRKHEGAATFYINDKKKHDILNVISNLQLLQKESNPEFILPIKRIIERLFINIYRHSFKNKICNNEIKDIFQYCINNPLLLEWKIVSAMGNLGFKSWDILSTIKKVYRKLYYILCK